VVVLLFVTCVLFFNQISACVTPSFWTAEIFFYSHYYTPKDRGALVFKGTTRPAIMLHVQEDMEPKVD
jgi:hypothetical protein